MSRKLTVTLIFFLFLLPFVSWYYLKSGLTWRQKAQEVLSGTQPFPEMAFRTPMDIPMEQAQLENHVSLITLMACDSFETQVEFVALLYAQFKETHKANFLFVDTCSRAELHFPDSLRQDVFFISCDPAGYDCRLLMKDWPAGKTFALVDKESNVRAYYATQSKEEKKTLVEHMALLLPRDYSEKVQLRRDIQKH